MASLSFIIGVLGNIVSILVFTSPMGTFWRVVRNKSTENFKGIPYVATFLSTSMWTFYGLLKPDILVVTVNAAGAALQSIYLILFLLYAPRATKAKILQLVLILDLGLLGSVIGLVLFAVHRELRLRVLGVLCAGLTIGMYASPLASMRTVIKTKSIEYMPFFLSFFLFLNGGVWSLYSILTRDFFIGVPNAIGFMLGSSQLILYGIYRRGSLAISSTREKAEEFSIQLIAASEQKESATLNRTLHKGKSLPISNNWREQRQQEGARAHSLAPFEFHSLLVNIRNGD